MYEALWSPSCDSMWVPTLARAGRAGGAKKLTPAARKYFFDSIGPVQAPPPPATAARQKPAFNLEVRPKAGNRTSGGVAERSIAPALHAGRGNGARPQKLVPNPLGGSNPSVSAPMSETNAVPAAPVPDQKPRIGP
jgi:hypothetical protein